MGKVILTERQYKNLKRTLISKSINESNNQKKRILNEGYIPSADGMSLTVSSDDYIGVEGNMIKGGAVLKISGWNELICTQCQYQGSSSEIIVGNFKYNCMVQLFTIDKGVMSVTSDDTIMPGMKKLCAKSLLYNYNWGGSGTDPERYWNMLLEKLKPYGVKTSDGTPQAGPFLYWGKNYIMKNYLADAGWNIIINGKSYKFTDYKGKYAGQELKDITLTPKLGGASEKLLTLLGQSSPGTETETVAGTDNNIVLFQRWYWSIKEEDLKLISGDVDDECKAKYASALCGGRPCIRGQAVDGKMGGNTTKLMNDATIKKEFDNWSKANPTKLAEYSKLDKCSSAQKGYTNPNPKPKPKTIPKTIPVNTGGGGQRTNIAAPTGYEQSLK